MLITQFTTMKKSTITLVILLLITALNSPLFAQRFAPTFDTYIDQTPANVGISYGTSGSFIVRTTSTQQRITFMEFDIADFSEQVSKAELCLYVSGNSTTTGNDDIDVFEVKTGTINNTITWSGFTYTLASTPITSLNLNNGTGWRKFDIKDLVNTLAATSGSNKKIKIALKARSNVLYFSFHSSENTSFPQYAPFLVMTPAMPSGLIEKSRTSVVEDGHIESVYPTSAYNDIKLLVNYYLTGGIKQYRNANLRFNVPSITLGDNTRVTIKTKVKSADTGVDNTFVVDLKGINNLADATDVNTLTWNTMPAAENYTYLRSKFFGAADKTNETNVEWDVTSYVKAQKTAGKSYANFTLQIPEMGWAGGGNLAFYSLNAGSTTIPELIVYGAPSTITSFSPTSAGNGTSVIITGTNLSDATAVSFGGTAASSFTVNSDTQITAIVAAGTTGIVSVSTPGSTATKTGFTFIAPSITGAANATAFTTTYGTASSAQTFAVSGSNLGANITATAPTGFEVSSDGITYGSTATFTKSGNTASGTLSVRLKANATVSGSYNTQNIVLSSAGATSVNIVTASSGNIVSAAANSITGTNLSNSGLTDEQLANTNITVSSGELVIDASKTVQSLTINPGAKLTISAGQTFSATNGITLQSTADGTATLLDETDGNGQTLTGSVQQYLATTRNWYVSSPVSNANAPSGYTYYRRNEPTAGWTAVSSGAGLTAGVGYIALPNSTGPITFSTQAGGKINTGIIAIPLTWQGASNKGYNLIGNPYPSHLTWNKAFTDTVASKIEPTIWYRTNSGSTNSAGWSFKTYNAFTGVGVPEGTTGIIPPMQAFWVLAKVDGQSIYFKNSMRSHQSSNPLKAPAAQKSENKLIRLQVSNGTASDETVLLFNNNAVDGYDNYDSPKMLNNSNDMPDIYTLADAKKLVINGMSEAKFNSEISIGINAIQNNTFSISANEISNFEAGTKLILRDKLLSKEVELNNDTQYSFTSEVASTENRFSILVKAPSSTTNVINNNDGEISIYGINNEIVVSCSDILNGENLVTVHTIVGSRLFAEKINSSYTKLNTTFASGIYLVTVKNGAKSITKKIVIQN